MSDLVERLRKVDSGPTRHPGVATNWHRNPDGPEAADAIERLTAERDRLRHSLSDALVQANVDLEKIAALRADCDRLAQLIKEHNDGCQSACGVGDEEGVACKYRPYFPRRCPECPVDWQIDAALQEKRDE